MMLAEMGVLETCNNVCTCLGNYVTQHNFTVDH